MNEIKFDDLPLVVSRDELSGDFTIDPDSQVVAEIEARRPTITRTALGLLFGGIPGALLGFVWRKKERRKVYIR